jgi:hypothetical protein
MLGGECLMKKSGDCSSFVHETLLSVIHHGYYFFSSRSNMVMEMKMDAGKRMELQWILIEIIGRLWFTISYVFR